jgi:hypothetical protein
MGPGSLCVCPAPSGSLPSTGKDQDALEPPWWLNWLADLASVSGLSFAAIVPVGTTIISWILGYLPPTPRPKVHLQTKRSIRSGNPPRVSLIDEAYGLAYRAIIGAHKSKAEQFWFVVAIIVGLVICCVIYLYVSRHHQALPIFPVLLSFSFYGIAVLALITALLIIRLHLKIRYENALPDVKDSPLSAARRRSPKVR